MFHRKHRFYFYNSSTFRSDSNLPDVRQQEPPEVIVMLKIRGMKQGQLGDRTEHRSRFISQDKELGSLTEPIAVIDHHHTSVSRAHNILIIAIEIC
jgi:hypothetical protein